MATDRSTQHEITFDTPVEDLALNHPKAVRFLTERGIRCIRCGEPLWCSVSELFEQDNAENPRQLLNELNEFIKKENN
ncbi:DUF1858 domain-containing protein [candidate division KSB1 bacterium]|nr:DUF1858 domain-containing protein [candidate division KSB1 bacterium]